MERYRPYEGRRHPARRRRSGVSGAFSYHPERTRARTVKLGICVGLFALAALFKLLFPSAFALAGEKINTVVNYKAALTALGEGISGEKKFTTALSEAFTYAFTGTTAAGEDTVEISPDTVQTAPMTPVKETPADTEHDGTENRDTGQTDTGQAAAEDSVAAFSEAKPPDEGALSFSEAVIAAFKESQEEYSDYAVPAGVSFDMPVIMFAHTAPLCGTVSSPFGFRIHPTKNTVIFHYGTDVAAPKGAEIVAFAEGKVIAAGESTTLGKYVILSHGNVQTQYAHCSNVCVESGQTVVMGERIASVGKTGNATYCHLHFELKVNGQCVNPAFYIGEWQ